jgi:hypothetical protein
MTYFAAGDVMTPVLTGFATMTGFAVWTMTGHAVWMMTGFALEGFNMDRICGLFVTGFALVGFNVDRLCGFAVWMMTGFALVGFNDVGGVVGFIDVGFDEVGFLEVVGDDVGLRVNKTGVVSFSITPL